MNNAIVERKDQAPVAVTSESATMLQVIQSMATNPACDMDKLERLMELKERMDAKVAEADFNAALSRVQGNMGRVGADATNNQTRSQYATYGKLDKAVRPIYTAEGFSLSFSTEKAGEGMVGMVCYVSHRGGHTREYRAEVPSDGKGARGGDVMTKTHAFGSGTSYGMRYLLKMIFNIAIGEEDDDGNGAGEPKAEKTITEVQAYRLQSIASQCSDTVKRKFAEDWPDVMAMPSSKLDAVEASLSGAAKKHALRMAEMEKGQ